ncbi:LCP family protein [Streptomyces beihaiensis]|uniref:LCP family protein n=1 Tax=Streptomyces beihaiensis TaxID=2984495 RepID=A0ABT3U3Z9_9ACTN|nr:LCP family protein [Streptomyces beihaiensis]MCX3063376.1 LCP family protein [Streptomyces beihaiensis]
MGRGGIRTGAARTGRADAPPGTPASHAGEPGWEASRYEDGGGRGPSGSHKASPPGGGGRGHRGGHRRGGDRRRRGRILGWTAGVLAFLVIGTAGAGYLYYEHLNSNIQTGKLNLGDHQIAKPKPNAAGQTPLNILLIGSDARDTKENQKLGGAKNTFGGAARADVQMLVHLSADRSNMSVVSIPRDTLIKLPKCTDPKTGKVYPATSTPKMANESLTRGGPGCTVATWESFTGIHIDHYIMVDFAGVVSMADAIGGVPVCVDANIYSRDRNGHGSGLRLKKGTTSVKGLQALQWLRTRYGFEDGTDIARAKAQHMYMSSMERQMRKNATFSHPGKLRELAEQATRSLHVDDGLHTVKKLYDLTNELKKPKPSRITMTTMPFVYVGERVAPKPGDAEKLFRLVRDDIPLDGKGLKKKKSDDAQVSDDPAAPAAQIGVQVRNGTRTATTAAVPRRASRVARVLVGKGYTRAAADQSGSVAQERTQILFPSKDLEGDAQKVAKSLGIPLGSVKQSTDVSGVTLIVGADWTTGDSYPKDAAAKDTADDDKAPKSDQTINGADGSKCMHVQPGYTW